MAASVLKYAWHAAELVFSAAGTWASIFGLGQTTLYHKHDLMWAEIDYFLQIRQVHIEALNDMREDLQDMYEMDGRKLDTRMIVATLLLAIGFGFAVEGTFPPDDPGKSNPRRDVYTAQHTRRIIYAITAALGLLSSMWSMMAVLECKRRLDFFMDHFNEKFYRMLKDRLYLFLRETSSMSNLHESSLVRYTEGLPEESHPDLAHLYDLDMACVCQRSRTLRRWFRCDKRRPPQRRDPRLDRSASYEVENEFLHAPGDFKVILALHSHYATWWYEWCQWLETLSSWLTSVSIIFNVVCCAFLVGMYFQFSYPDTPTMWQGYSYLLLAGLAVSLVLKGVLIFTGPRLDARRKYISKVGKCGIPEWMSEGGAAPLLQT